MDDRRSRRDDADMDESYEEGGDDRGRSRFVRRPRVCQFCLDKVLQIDYKNAETLRRLVSDRGKIRPRRQTGTCARHQRALAVAIKRARHMAIIDFGGHRERSR